jgi:hypothetical protein
MEMSEIKFVKDIAISVDGATLAVAADSGFYLFASDEDTSYSEHEGHWPKAVAFLDDDTLLLGDDDGIKKVKF